MKIKTLSLLFAILFVVIPFAFADNVDQATAEQVAKNCYYQQTNAFDTPVDFGDINISNITLESKGDMPIMYVVEIENGGFVLVSAQDVMVPVLGYNTTPGAKFDIPSRGPEFNCFITNLMDVIENLVNVKYEQEEKIANQWSLYTTEDYNSLLASKDDVQVGPLLTSEWNQTAPYNYYAPTGTPNGCVATAMAVVMHYFSWPLIGIGEHSYNCPGYGQQSANFAEAPYNYELLPNTIASSDIGEVILEGSRLQYHCAVSVNMTFATDGSGAMSTDVPNALHTYFSYPYASFYQKTNSTSWENLLKQQLDYGYPLYHSGYSQDGGGHAWNCDGYRTINDVTTYHHNFNWGGYENEWYSHANPGGFNQGQGILRNFYPPADGYPNYASGHRVLTEKYGRIQDGSGPLHDYLANTSASWLIDPETEHDSLENVKLQWESLELGAGDYIRVYDGEDATAELLYELTEGSELPEEVTSTNNKFFVDFQSTGSAPGFVFTYTTKRYKLCNSTTNITVKEVYIQSNPEDKYYNPATLCRWKILIPTSGGGIINFDYLDTYDENDFVSFNHPTTGEEYGSFYGQEIPEQFEVPATGVMITFKTDKYNSIGNGFGLTYTDYTLGLEDVSVGGVKVYPNPATNKLNIILENEVDEAEVQIISMTGALLYQEKLGEGKAKYSTVDVSNYPAGVYFVKVASQNGVVTNKIVIE